MKKLEIRAQADALTLYIYGEIGESLWSERSTEAMDVIDALADGNGRPVDVRLNSPGGSVNDALAIYNALERYPAAVNVYIDGIAYSAASLIAMAGDSVEMASNSLMMIHAPSTLVEGNAQELEAVKRTLEAYQSAMLASYVRNDDKLNRATVEAWLSDGEDHYFTAAEALELGLVDRVGPAQAAAAIVKREDRNMSDVVTTEKARDDERARVMAIQSLFAMDTAAGIAVEERQRLLAHAIKAGWTEAETATAILKALPLAAPSGTGEGDAAHGGTLTLGRDQIDNVDEGISDALIVRMGLDKDRKVEAKVRQSEYMGMSAVEMARRCLETDGKIVRGLNRNQIVGQALTIRADRGLTHTSSDFPALVENAVNKAVLRGWDEAPETWRMIARSTTIPDFKPAPRSGLGAYPTPPEVPEGGEYKYVTISDRKETIVLLTYGSMLGVTRQLLVNDDLNQLGQIGMKQGRAAARRVGDLVYLVLTGNPTMEQTGLPLFDAGHSNLATVTGAPNVTTLDNHRVIMGLQTDNDQNAHGLNLRPRRMVVPLELETTANVLRASQYDPADTNNSRAPNPFQNAYEVVADPRLSADSATQWYTTEDPNGFDVIEAGFLEGATDPYLESRQGWTRDGVEFKVRIDCAAIPLDYRTMVRNTGV